MGIESVLLKSIPTLVSLLESVYNQGILFHVLIGLFIIESVLSFFFFEVGGLTYSDEKLCM
ncbi:hypothetical protein ABE23_14185 [Bacillus thuringiensis]|uniref:Uncharacterized protein n=2 Tax=Bacillus thuringiensis TaxID=1428 RepID=A0AAP4V5I6_BACTU|nr:hypothetical protein CT43_CH5490 [Bacillus thuringiensis serovar chinensis CT-43]AGG04292.1 hypothetical protein H175_ch5583 [Bacillus thuringiensis serovar thuringiensis str. IS5056]ANC10799.1 hypothetical protein WR47_28005 [Bacillus cereus]ARP60763.1 hypothetical protein CAB88_28350 [Bacillus thuringiensis]EEM25863.1 hypothetical protein bthur0002_53180 [Bacillus thuringiensis Bt407]EEM32234.1 hypothetical protein bthur0003_52730 [Bacillus thuringiensis serovar thuringiensis str. T01001]